MTTRYAPIEAWLAHEIGLDPSSVGPSTIALAIASRMAAQETSDVAEYTALVARSRVEAQQLIEAIVVPETSFFRDHHPFVALQQWAVEEWLPRNATGVMRLLSMPCSTGEEPFSMAIALLQAGVERFLVEGVDISSGALSRAEEGLYRGNSFRGGMRDEVARYFTRERGNQWRIVDEVRRHVRFRQANLLDPAFGEGSPLYDVIFCRNLLIYLDAAAQRKVMAKIKASLAPGGLLCVGHAEAYLFSQFGFTPRGPSMSFCFRVPAALPELGAHRVQPPVVSARPLLVPQAAMPPLPPIVVQEHQRLFQPVLPKPERKSGNALEESQRMADAGAFGQAEELALLHLREHGPSARLFCLLAVICDAQGREDEAAGYYRKTLYLEPDYAEALAHLSLLLRRRGDLRGAEQLQRRLRRVQEQGGLRV